MIMVPELNEEWIPSPQLKRSEGVQLSNVFLAVRADSAGTSLGTPGRSEQGEPR
jgi:hypothetical protein